MSGVFNIFRYSTTLFLLSAGALSLILFSVKYQVQDLEQELKDLNHAIIADREAIHVLKAEWAFLNDPARLGVVVDRFFDLQPIRPDQLVTFEGIPVRGEGGGQ